MSVDGWVNRSRTANGPIWPIWAKYFSQFEVHLGHISVNLRSIWAHFGHICIILVPFGAFFGLIGLYLSQFEVYFCPFEPTWPVLAYFGPIWSIWSSARPWELIWAITHAYTSAFPKLPQLNAKYWIGYSEHSVYQKSRNCAKNRPVRQWPFHR